MLSVTAKDGIGNESAESESITFTVDTISPTVPTIETTGLTTNITDQTITGEAEAGTLVTLYLDGVATSVTATAADDGTFSLPATTLSEGDNVKCQQKMELEMNQQNLSQLHSQLIQFHLQYLR